MLYWRGLDKQRSPTWQPPTLTYVAPPATPQFEGLEPEPVVIYDLPAGGGGATTWAEVTDKPAVIAAGATASAARTAIDAGTSDLAIGTTATTAAAGNHNHAVTADAASGLAAAANIQALATALSARIKALEDATP